MSKKPKTKNKNQDEPQTPDTKIAMKKFESRPHNLIDSLAAPSIEKDDTQDYFDAALQDEIAEKIDEITPEDAKSFGLELDDVLNYSNGMLMMKFADNVIKNGPSLFRSPDL
jgi:hypothetical protein